jgi:hypothetical protein
MDFVKEIEKIDKNAEKAIIDLMDKYDCCDFNFCDTYPIHYHTADGTKLANVVGAHLGGADYNEVVFYTDERMSLYRNDVVSGTMASFVPIIKSEFKDFTKRVNQQSKMVSKEPKWEKRIFFLPDKYNPCDLSDEDFAGRAFMHGKVWNMEELAIAFNNGNLGDFHPDMGTIRILDYSKTCVEMCPNCEYEVVLESKFKMQLCPICGKPIAPCSLCDASACGDCPLHC